MKVISIKTMIKKMKKVEDYINKVLENYTTIKDYSENRQLLYSSVYQLIEKCREDIRTIQLDGRTKFYLIKDLDAICREDIRTIQLDGRTKLYLIKDLDAICQSLMIKKGMKIKSNIHTYDPF